MPNVDTTQIILPEQSIEQVAKERFNRKLMDDNAFANTNIIGENFNVESAKKLSNDAMIAMEVQGGIQTMLAAQMLSIHTLQQRTMVYAHGVDNMDLKKFYINAAVKLANCFVQQAGILAKLQGIGEQKITVERVDISNGSQAVIGTVNRSISTEKANK